MEIKTDGNSYGISMAGSEPGQKVQKNLPEMKFRAGSVVATVWSNKTVTKTGEEASYSTISIERSYKDKNGIWQKTTSLRINDLPKAALVLTKAYEGLVLNKQKSVA